MNRPQISRLELLLAEYDEPMTKKDVRKLAQSLLSAAPLSEAQIDEAIRKACGKYKVLDSYTYEDVHAVVEEVFRSTRSETALTERAQSEPKPPADERGSCGIELRGRPSQEGASTQASHSQAGSRVETPASTRTETRLLDDDYHGAYPVAARPQSDKPSDVLTPDVLNKIERYGLHGISYGERTPVLLALVGMARRSLQSSIEPPAGWWSFVRSVLSQGASIQQDYVAGNHKSYEEYSARLDAAARERAEEISAVLARSATRETAALQALADIKWDIENCGWHCHVCGVDQGMKETDIAGTIRHFEEAHGALPNGYSAGATDSRGPNG